MIIVFAGAGASKAVNPKNYPTTVEFFDRLPGSFNEDQLFGQIISFLRKSNENGVGKVVDIEQVLWELNLLKQFCESTYDPNDIISWLLEPNRFNSILGIETSSTTNVHNAIRKLSGWVNELQDTINEQVYRLYGTEPDKSELANNWQPLLHELAKIDPEIEIFTTNYDVILENALEIYSEDRKNNKHLIELGKRRRVHKIIDLDAWRTRPQRPYIRLTKLHGSVDWVNRNDDTIWCSVPKFTGNHDDHIIIYPGFKGTPNEEPFYTFHSHLAETLKQSNSIVFIGFAFRDEYINALLSGTHPAAHVAIIDPATTLPNCPFEKDHVSHLGLGFSEKAVSTVLMKIKNW